jgi:hypothetical protein
MDAMARSSRSSRSGHRHGNALGPVWATESHPDNTFGRGYYPLPNKLKGLGRFMENLAPRHLVEHKAFVDARRPTIHMLTAKVDRHFSVLLKDMESLIAHGFVRMQSNEPGTVSFYFQE